MNEFHEQAKYNEEFLGCIKKSHPNKFYDWRITVIFYIAIHLLKALGKKRGINVGSTHHEIFSNFDKIHTANPISVLPDEVWIAYKRMYQYSKTSRYQGISNISLMELAYQKDLEEVEKLKKTFCDYMSEQHLRVS